MDWLYELGSLVPPVLTGLLFWFVMRAILRADRKERDADRAAEQAWQRGRAEGERPSAAPPIPSPGAAQSQDSSRA